VFNELKYDQMRDLLRRFFSRIKKVVTKTLLPWAFKRPQDKEICTVYNRLLGRQPDSDELLHWKISASKIDDVTSALLQSYEYEQKRVNQQRVLVDIQKFKIYAMMSDADVGRTIIQSQSHEPHVEHILKEILHTGDVFLDLGANIGYFSLLAASIVQGSGKVIAFEPNTQNLQLLYASIFENQFSNITVYPFAAADKAQILKLTSFGSNGFIGAPQSSQVNAQFLQSVIVDDLLQNEKKINVIKIDIEGYEPLALRGMGKTIERHKPIIVTEFSPWHIKHRTEIAPQDYLRQLCQYGYDLWIIEPSGSATSAPSINFVMDFWGNFGNDKQNLDLIARPREK
jgi:FkbM family methyltransferase